MTPFFPLLYQILHTNCKFSCGLCAFWEIYKFCGNFNTKFANFGLKLHSLHTKWPPFLGVHNKKIKYFRAQTEWPSFFNEILHRMPPISFFIFKCPSSSVARAYQNGNFLWRKSISCWEKNQVKWLCPLLCPCRSIKLRKKNWGNMEETNRSSVVNPVGPGSDYSRFNVIYTCYWIYYKLNESQKVFTLSIQEVVKVLCQDYKDQLLTQSVVTIDQSIDNSLLDWAVEFKWLCHSITIIIYWSSSPDLVSDKEWL